MRPLRTFVLSTRTKPRAFCAASTDMAHSGGTLVSKDEKLTLHYLLLSRVVAERDKEAWYNETFAFPDQNLPFLRQRYDGPCGVLAVVQARIIRAYCQDGVRSPRPSDTNKVLLSLAIAKTIWLAAQNSRSGVAEAVFFAADSSTGDWRRYVTRSLTELVNAIYLNQNDTSQYGILPFLCSVIASKGGIEWSNLLTERGDCDQTLVSLLISGRAALTLADGHNPDFPGIHQRTDIGFLPTPDVAEELQLGTFLKSPPYPVWIVNRAAHYSVVFCEDVDLLQNRPGAYTLCYLRLSGRSALLKMTLSDQRVLDERDWSQTRYGIVECLRVRWPNCAIDVIQGDGVPHQEVDN